MKKTEQQESVEGILDNYIFGKYHKHWKQQAKQQLESFYKEKYLGGLEERIKEEIKSAIYVKEIKGLDKVLSIIQEELK